MFPGFLKQIDHGLTKAVWGVRDDDAIYRLKHGNLAWKRIPGALKHVSAGKAGIWGVERDNNIYYRDGVNESNPDGTSWRVIVGKLKQVDSGPTGIVYGVDSNGTVYCRSGIESGKPFGTNWMQVMPSIAMKYVSCGERACWGVNTANNPRYRSEVTKDNCAGKKWHKIIGDLTQIEVGKWNDVYGINSAGEVFRRIRMSKQERIGRDWRKILENGSHITTGVNGQYLLVNGGQIHHYNGRYIPIAVFISFELPCCYAQAISLCLLITRFLCCTMLPRTDMPFCFK